MLKIITETISNISLDESCADSSVKVRHGKRKIKILNGIDLRGFVEGSLFFCQHIICPFPVSLMLINMVGAFYRKVTVQ